MQRINVAIVRLMAPEDASDEEMQVARDSLNTYLNEAEDEISSGAPEGYYVKIDAYV
jgi:hypothetical protein